MEKTILEFKPILYNRNLIPKVIYDFVSNWRIESEKIEFLVAEIDPQFANGIELCEKYKIDIKCGANCLIAVGIRGEIKTYVACIVPVGYKYNMSSVVRKEINARVVSVAPLEYVLEKTQMEYGSITPIGLPNEWSIFVDPLVLLEEQIVIGGGYKNSKISIPSKLLLALPNVKILNGLAKLI